MRRTVPLLITALAGLVLIASRFIPAAESWGEVATIWFDILASVAFVLGGGSLFKLQLKKISDRAAGWGYSAVTLLAFLVMLFAGLTKIGSQPAAQQEFYGQSFAPLSVDDLPASTTVRVAGSTPPRADGEELPLSVKRQLREEGGQLVFRGWMTPRQQAELSEFKETLSWQCTVEKLFEMSQPKPPIKGKVTYLVDHSALSGRGLISDDVRKALLALNGNERWNQAVETLYKAGQRKVTVSAPQLPSGYQIPPSMHDFLFYDEKTHELGIRGPMSPAIRDTLARATFPQVHPLNAETRRKFRGDLESLGSPLNAEQATALDNALAKSWVVDKLRVSLDEAGKAVEIELTPCEREQARKAAESNPAAAQTSEPKKSGPDQTLNERQRAELNRFAADPAMTVATLAELLRSAGPFNDRQAAALEEFFDKIPTVAEQKLDLCVKLLRDGPLSRRQIDFLVDDYRQQNRWRNIVGQLFVRTNAPKYPWSGPYNTPGSTFGWLYEFTFKPLQATMFSLLAFYVASAAFRAFRAKNLQAILLLATAFIILLGQTFAGYWLTSWIPDSSPVAFLKIKSLTEFVAVFLTAGSRAIMIGIALGVASTSLKMLLGIDRSYLGTGD
jgi:hypothetical protein